MEYTPVLWDPPMANCPQCGSPYTEFLYDGGGSQRFKCLNCRLFFSKLANKEGK